MGKRTITVRGVPDQVLQTIREVAEANRRSLNGELLVILERAGTSRLEANAVASSVKATAVEPYAAVPESASSPQALPEAVNRDALAAICRRHHIRWLAVFGSWARGDARPDSDVDVVVDFESGMTPGLGIVTVAEALRPVLGGRRVDLVTRKGLRPPLSEHILATALPLYGN